MRHTFRFLGEPAGDGSWHLQDEEAHHLAKVLRLGVGTTVEVTDGRGHWATGTVTSLNTREALITPTAVYDEPAPRLRLEMAVGALKPGAVDDMLPMLCELGLDTIHIFGQQGVAKVRLAPKALERWQRVIVQATKQCKRAWLPVLREHASVAALLADIGSEPSTRVLLRGASDPPLPRVLPKVAAGGVLVAVGGEKGFDHGEEQRLLAAGFAPASLGPFVLRAVTATLAAAATLSLHRQDL